MDSDGTLSLDGRERPMAPRWVTYERTGGWLLTSVIALPLLVAGAVVLMVFVDPLSGVLIPFGVGLIVVSPIVWYQFSFLPRAYARMSWLAAPDRIELRKGVWWRKVITVPKRNVQHTDVTQGPLQRRFGIASLVVHTAGTQHAKVEVPGLHHHEAVALRDWLIAQPPGKRQETPPSSTEESATDDG